MGDETYSEFIAFLSTLAARCTTHFPLIRARAALPPALRALLAHSRALAFKAKLLKDRNLPGEPSTRFWSKTKGHFRDISASLRGFLLPTGESVRDPQVMAEAAADYYEELLDAPSVMRPHPLVTYPEIVKILAKRKKKRSCDIHELSSYLLEQMPSQTRRERSLFLNRFRQVLKDRDIVPENKSGFRAGHRLQTRVLLLVEQISF